MPKRGFDTWWVRVAEKPVMPYSQWELHLLRLRNPRGGSLATEAGQAEGHERPETGTRFVDYGSALRWFKFLQELRYAEAVPRRGILALEPAPGD